MLNFFPIQFLSMFAYALLRVCIGILLIRAGWKHIGSRREIQGPLAYTFPFFPLGSTALWIIAITELASGIMFLLGLYTQIGALLSMVLCLKLIIWNSRLPMPFFEKRSFYTLLFFASLSLFITGAGVFAFDLPI